MYAKEFPMNRTGTVALAATLGTLAFTAYHAIASITTLAAIALQTVANVQHDAFGHDEVEESVTVEATASYAFDIGSECTCDECREET